MSATKPQTTCSHLPADPCSTACQPNEQDETYLEALLMIADKSMKMPQLKHLIALWLRLKELCPAEQYAASLQIREYERVLREAE